MKEESDYRTTYAKRLGEEITKEQARKTAAAGTEDEDVLTAESDAVIEWLTLQKSQQEEMGAHAKEVYDEARA